MRWEVEMEIDVCMHAALLKLPFDLYQYQVRGEAMDRHAHAHSSTHSFLLTYTNIRFVGKTWIDMHMHIALLTATF